MDVFEGNRKAYDQIVLEFARRNHVAREGRQLELLQRLVRTVGRNGSIIDIGCGTGRDMMFFESQGVNVTGIDLSSGMLSYARQEVRGGLAIMNMCQIGFPPVFFDGVWSCASLLHLPKHLAPGAVQEMRRILKPGGMLILRIQAGDCESWEETYTPGIPRFFARYGAEEMMKILTCKGFSVLEFDSIYERHRDWLSFICVAE
jgi:ubiquinone/menaquinone biosynthesis C-methylase UbiE